MSLSDNAFTQENSNTSLSNTQLYDDADIDWFCYEDPKHYGPRPTSPELLHPKGVLHTRDQSSDTKMEDANSDSRRGLDTYDGANVAGEPIRRSSRLSHNRNDTNGSLRPWRSVDHSRPLRGPILTPKRVRQSGYIPTDSVDAISTYKLEAQMDPSSSYVGTYIAPIDVHNEFCVHKKPPQPHFQEPFDPSIEYLLGQWECGFTNDKKGRLHYQFYVKFSNPQKITTARHKLGHKIPQYFAPARSDEAAIAYVSKAATAVSPSFTYGQRPPGKGHPKGLDACLDFCMEGNSLFEVLKSDHKAAYARKSRFYNDIISHFETPRKLSEEPYVAIYWGTTGAGKSTDAHKEYPDAYRKTVPGKWYENYRGEDVVIYEDYNPLTKEELDFPLHVLLTHLDKFGCKIEKKGSSCQLKASKFIFTSNIDPKEWFQGHPQQDAFYRRVKLIRHYHTEYRHLKPGASSFDEFDSIRLH